MKRYIALAARSWSDIAESSCMTAMSAISPESQSLRGNIPRLWNGAVLYTKEVYEPFQHEDSGATYHVLVGAAPDDADIYVSNWVTSDTIAGCVQGVDKSFLQASGFATTMSILDRDANVCFLLLGDAERLHIQAQHVDSQQS